MKTLTAREGGYLTQTADIPFEERTFVKAVSGVNVDNYRDATDEEIDLWQKIKSGEIQPLSDARKALIENIRAYDQSDMVNAFFVGGQKMWLDKATRAGLMLRFQAEQASGKTDTTLWYEGAMYALPLATAFQMLYALEVYASECYDNTQSHLSEAQKLTSVDAIESYDYKMGYPDYLRF